MSKITNDGLTQSGTGCFIAVPISQRWASIPSKGYDLFETGGCSAVTADNHQLTCMLAVQKRLLKEQLQYLDYLSTARQVQQQKEADIEKMMREDQLAQNHKQLMKEKREAEVRRKLFCDVFAVQQEQRQEKGNTSPSLGLFVSFRLV